MAGEVWRAGPENRATRHPPPLLHEQPLRSYEKPLWPPGQVREVMHPANHPEEP